MPDLYEIQFTQFLLPDGEQRQEKIARPKEIYDLAMPCIYKGGRFTVEMLQNGVISLACEYDDEDICMEISENGPDITEKVDKLVKDSHAIIFKNSPKQ